MNFLLGLLCLPSETMEDENLSLKNMSISIMCFKTLEMRVRLHDSKP